MRLFIACVSAALLASVVTFGLARSALAPVAISLDRPESTYARIMRTGVLRCGYSAWKPLMWVDPNSGQKTGIFPDLAAEIGKRLHLKIVWQEELGWGTVVEAVKSGRVDMACAGYWLQPNRYKFVASSTPLLYAPIYVWGRESDHPARVEDLNSAQYTVVESDGGATNQVASQLFPKARVLSLPELSTNADLIENLPTHKGDFVLDDATSFENYMENNPHKVKNLFPDHPVAVYPAVMLLPPEDPHLKQVIDDAMRDIDNDGTLDTILRTYHMERGFLRNPKPVVPPLSQTP